MLIGGLAWLLLASTPPQHRHCYFHVSEEDAEAQVAGVICLLSLSQSRDSKPGLSARFGPWLLPLRVAGRGV